MATTAAEKAEAFLELHAAATMLVLPNAWTPGVARVIVGEGFPAVATTSAGIAFSLGLPDGERVSRDVMLSEVGRIARSVDVPVSADLETGYGAGAENVAETIRLAIEAGVVGGNLEDGAGSPDKPLHAPEFLIERIEAARRAGREAGVHFVINARTDTYLVRDRPEPELFDETVRRCGLYRAAGADCLFVPGVADADTIGRLARAIDGPLNVVAGLVPGMASLSELERLGVARVSTGGTLARASMAVVRGAARELRDRGTYGFAEAQISHGELNAIFAKWEDG